MENKQLIFDQYFVKRAENYKITAMDYIDNYLYIGTTQGSVFKQRIKTLDSPKGKTLPDGQEVKLFKYGPKQQIIKIACIRSIRQVVVQAGDLLMHFEHSETGQNKKPVPVKIQGNCFLFEVNQCKEEKIMLIKSHRFSTPEVLFFRYSKSKRSYEPLQYWTKDVTLPQKPLRIAYSDRTINIAFSYQYSFINFEPNQAEKDYTSDCQIIKKPFVFSVAANLFINAGPQNISFFVNNKGKLEQKNPIIGFEQPIKQMVKFKDYLVVLYDNLIQVFSIGSSKELQKIPVKNTKCISNRGEYLFFTDGSNIHQLYLIPFDIQIVNLLMNNKVQEAHDVFNQMVPKNNQNRKVKEEAFNLQAGWILLKKFRLQQSVEKFSKTNIDIRELIALFPEYIPQHHDQIKVQKGLTMKDIILKIFREQGSMTEQQEQKSLQQALKKPKIRFLL